MREQGLSTSCEIAVSRVNAWGLRAKDNFDGGTLFVKVAQELPPSY